MPLIQYPPAIGSMFGNTIIVAVTQDDNVPTTSSALAEIVDSFWR